VSDDGREPERVRETERTTVVDTGGGGDRTSLALVALVLVVGLAAILFFLLRGGDRDKTDKIGVNVTLPEVKAPDINVNLPEVKVPARIELPEVDVKSGDGSSNKADGGGR
jgi:hypothetical protein